MRYSLVASLAVASLLLATPCAHATQYDYAFPYSITVTPSVNQIDSYIEVDANVFGLADTTIGDLGLDANHAGPGRTFIHTGPISAGVPTTFNGTFNASTVDWIVPGGPGEIINSLEYLGQYSPTGATISSNTDLTGATWTGTIIDGTNVHTTEAAVLAPPIPFPAPIALQYSQFQVGGAHLAPLGPTTLSLFNFSDGAPGGTISINISQPTLLPEPSTAAILLLPSLFLRRRKRPH